MKRKLAIFGLCFAGAELFAANMPPLVLVPAAALLLLLLFLSIVRRSRAFPLVLGAAAGFCWFCAFSFAVFRPMRALAGQTVTCMVTVEMDATAAYQNGQLRGTLTVTGINGKSCHFKMRSNGFPAQEPGETFTADFTMTGLPKDAYRASRLSRGILLQGEYTGGYKTGADSCAPRFALYRLRKNASALLRRWLPRDLGGLEAAMLLGDKAALPDTVRDTFRAAGISHLLAVSGLHLALLCGLFSFGRRRRFYRPLILVRAAVAVFYMLLTGLPISVLRAGIGSTSPLTCSPSRVRRPFCWACKTLTRPATSAFSSLFAPCWACRHPWRLPVGKKHISPARMPRAGRPNCAAPGWPCFPLCRRRRWHRWRPCRCWSPKA